MCLPVCPTYELTHQEQSSPRGRIRLMRSLHEGTLDLSPTFVDEMHFCLDCQACQTACPAGVQYGTLVEDARRVIAEHGKEPLTLRIIKSVLLRGILSSKARTKFVASLLRFYRKSGVQQAIDDSHILTLISEKLQAKHALLPAIEDEWFDGKADQVIPTTAAKRGRVAFLSGCIMNIAFPGIHRDVVSVLTTNGFEVIIPKNQVCCGSLHAHYGDTTDARSLARKNIDAFVALDVDAIIVDAAGCGAFLKEYHHLLADDKEYAAKAESIARKTKDITEFLAEVGFELPEPCEGLKPSQGFCATRVTYHEACHLVHTQKISQQPRQIIESIPGVQLVELPEATWCCGSAGIYNVVRYDDAMKLLERKMNHLASTKADIVLTANPGCHLQLQYGIKKFGLKMKVMHPVSLLRRAMGAH
jgi:glycolate oxidase iron-sulfur subunit